MKRARGKGGRGGGAGSSAAAKKSGRGSGQKATSVVVNARRTGRRVLEDLVRMVVRAFYSDEYVVLIDAMVRANRLVRDVDLAHYVHLQVKRVSALLSQLKADHFVKSETLSEQLINTLTGRTYSNKQRYWYIDYKHFINVLRYKLFIINQKTINSMNVLNADSVTTI